MDQNNPLVSIIIPTYNRAHLLGETLGSILAQTYTHWECIVVDDGSKDDTNILMQEYLKKDNRIQFHSRTSNYASGGNGARNFGFELSKGEFIQWFDSDDLMEENHLELKIHTILKHKADFVVSKSKYFNTENPYFHPYDYKTEDINFESFAITSVSWTIEDFMVSRGVALQEKFNEKLKSGQEYNFCCKLLLHIKKPFFIDEFLTKRRWVEDSIGNTRRKNQKVYLKSRFDNYWLNYLDIKEKAKNEKFNKHCLLVCLSAYFLGGTAFKLPRHFSKEIIKVFSWSFVYYYLSRFSFQLTGSYIYFLNKLKQS